MSKLIIVLICFLSFQTAHAQSFKVTKIAGKKAIVEVDDPKMISVGQTYNVGGDAMGMSSSSGSGTGGLRNNAISFDFGYTTQSSPSISVLSIGGSYLWNLRQFEVGPLLGLTTVSGGGSNSSTTTLGGIGFYNFNEHKPGTPTILAAVGQLAVTSGSGSSVTNIAAGGNYRWFLLSQDHCFSGSLLYKMAQTSGNNTSGFELSAGIMTYF